MARRDSMAGAEGRSERAVLIALALFAGQVVAPGSGPAEAAVAQAAEFRCRGADVVIRSGADADRGLICEAAVETIAFMAANGLGQISALTIDVAAAIPAGHAGSAGCYDWVSDTAFVREDAVCVRDGDLPQYFRIANTRAVRKSLVAHEVAHAIAARHFSIERPSVGAQEYIAGAVQFSVMDPETRDRILAQFEGTGHSGLMQMNGMLYYMNPARFLVESYRHFARPENGFGFVRALLSGALRPLDDFPY